jgi:glycosyltransferase involved in cell wall biosynthesis
MRRLLYLSCDPGIPVLGHKGASVHVREMASALCNLGVDVAVASPRIEAAGDTLDAPIRLLRLPRVSPDAPESELRVALEVQRREVLQAARSFSADGIYERYSLLGGAGVEAAATLGIPHVLEVNAPLREEARRFRTLSHPNLASAIEQQVFRGTGRIFAVSRALRRWLEQEGVESERIEVVPNAVAPDHFGPRQPRRSDEFVLGFCGSLKPWHGIEVLLEACAIAFSEDSVLRLEVVGGGPLDRLLESAGLPPDRLRALGPLRHTDAIERLRDWDVGLAPYLPLEGFYFSPLKVVEYMAASLCTVASDVGELPTLLADDRGVVVPSGDARRLASALLELARNRGRAAELGRRARGYVLETHTWEGNARVVLDAFQRSRELAA